MIVLRTKGMVLEVDVLRTSTYGNGLIDFSKSKFAEGVWGHRIEHTIKVLRIIDDGGYEKRKLPKINEEFTIQSNCFGVCDYTLTIEENENG